LENPDSALACRILDPGGILRAFTATFTPKENFPSGNYAMSACPTLHPGQTVEARWISPETNPGPLGVRLVMKIYDQDLMLQSVNGPTIILHPGSDGNGTLLSPEGATSNSPGQASAPTWVLKNDEALP
jgi:hypothetical protein